MCKIKRQIENSNVSDKARRLFAVAFNAVVGRLIDAGI